MAVSELVGPDAEIVPVSATTGEQLDVLTDVLAAQLPPGPAFYPDGELTDEPEEVLDGRADSRGRARRRARRATALAGGGHR